MFKRIGAFPPPAEEDHDHNLLRHSRSHPGVQYWRNPRLLDKKEERRTTRKKTLREIYHIQYEIRKLLLRGLGGVEKTKTKKS